MTPKWDLKKMLPETRVALAAVAVSATIGVLSAAASITASVLTTNATHSDVETQITAERQRRDLTELREVLDVAGTRLRNARDHLGSLEAYVGGVTCCGQESLRPLFRAELKRFYRAARQVADSSVTLLIRLGYGARTYDAYNAAATVCAKAYYDAQQLADNARRRPTPYKDGAIRLREAASTAAKEYNRFFDAASALARSSLP